MHLTPIPCHGDASPVGSLLPLIAHKTFANGLPAARSFALQADEATAAATALFVLETAIETFWDVLDPSSLVRRPFEASRPVQCPGDVSAWTQQLGRDVE
ncbi:hypothetical protein [uncultured Jannaschia sp.]|uniref:hypothetical protein n=1 Tax=uncultured Jannaschia sp. TaxID=293347 RepID=UPI0026017775|nr:hypothetical protein [uncultured Jannaschia sp.]